MEIDQNPRANLLTLQDWKNKETSLQGALFGGIKLPCTFEVKTLFNLFMVRNWNKFVNPMYVASWELAEVIKTLTEVHRPTLEKMWATVEATYPLVENYSMTETVETINTPNIKTSQESNTSATHNTSTSDTSTTTNTTTNTGNVVNGVTSFEDSVNFNDTERTDSTLTVTNNDNNNRSVKADELSNSEFSANTTRTGTDTTRTTTTRKGNIGVTTNQQMLKEEREIAKFNFLVYYLELIEKHLFLNIY